MSHVVFDLDGTLVDSLSGVATSLRAALELHAPEQIVPPLRSYIGPPIATMIRRLWPELPGEVGAKILTSFCKHYDAEGCLASMPFPSADQTLRRLHGAGLTLYLLTNKRLSPTLSIVRSRGWDALFAEIVTPESHEPAFPSKADAALALAGRRGLTPGSAVVIGDGPDDATAAAACGFDFIHAAYGYGQPAITGHAIENLAELERLLLTPDP